LVEGGEEYLVGRGRRIEQIWNGEGGGDSTSGWKVGVLEYRERVAERLRLNRRACGVSLRPMKRGKSHQKRSHRRGRLGGGSLSKKCTGKNYVGRTERKTGGSR